MSVPVSPLDGVYIISTVPRMKPPPTHVATQNVHAKVRRPSKGHVISASVKFSSTVLSCCPRTILKPMIFFFCSSSLFVNDQKWDLCSL